MTRTTKSELAERLKISAPRISQYIQQGLPVLSDGKIDFATALKWLSKNTLGPAGERAREMLEEMEVEDEGNPVNLAMNAALGCLFVCIPGIASQAAREAGATDEVVKKVAAQAHRLAVKQGNVVMSEMLGMSPRDTWPNLEDCKKFAVED